MTLVSRGGYPNYLGCGSQASGRTLTTMASERARRRCREQVLELTQRPADPCMLRFRIVELLRPVVGFDRWCWPVCDPGSGLGTTAVGDHDYWPLLPRLLLLDQRLDAPDTLPMLAGARARGGQDGVCAFSTCSDRQGSETSYASRCAISTVSGAALT